jgi:hypothetical protein
MAFNPLPDLPSPVQISQMDSRSSQPGVYFLWKGDTVVYVGQSKNVTERILQHIHDRTKSFDGISFIPCGPSALLNKERFFIRALLPIHNRCGVANSVRKTWEGHMDKRPQPDRMVTPKVAAEVLGVTEDLLPHLHRAGLPHKKVRIPRKNARRAIYSIQALHQFTAQHASRIIAVRNAQAG